MKVYVHTHVLLWVAKGELERLSASAAQALEDHELLASPAVMLELERLHEIGRLKASAEKTLAILESGIGLRVCALPFRAVATQALHEK